MLDNNLFDSNLLLCMANGLDGLYDTGELLVDRDLLVPLVDC